MHPILASVISLYFLGAAASPDSFAEEPTSDTQILKSPAGERSVQFPSDESLGPIYALGKGTLRETDWVKIAEARGLVALPVDNPLRLVIHDSGEYDWTQLASLPPDLIQHLVIQSTAIHESDLASVAKWNLLSLQMMNPRFGLFSSINGAALAHFRLMPSLKSVLLQSLTLDDKALEELSSFPALEFIQLYRTPQITDAGIESLKNIQTLKSLWFIDVGISDAALQSLSEINSLRSLMIEGTTRITNAGIKTIGNMTKLKGLTLPETITDEGLSELRNLASLEGLVLRSLRITDSGLSNLIGLNKLESLDLAHLGDDGVQYLAQLPALRRLVIHKIDFGEASFPALRKMSSLEEITIVQDDRPVALIKALQEALPNCRVVDEIARLDEALKEYRKRSQEDSP